MGKHVPTSSYRLTPLVTREGYFVYVDPSTGDVAREDWGGYLVPVPKEQESDLAARARQLLATGAASGLLG